MKKYCSTILILALLITQPTYPFIYTFECFNSPLRSGSDIPQKVIILGDNHVFEKEINGKQLEEMLNAVLVREQLPGKMKIFIEFPEPDIATSGEGKKKCPMFGLVSRANALDLEKTSIQNCEIRGVAKVASFLLLNTPSVLKARFYNHTRFPDMAIESLKNYGCNLATLTFQQVLENFDCLRRQCKLYKRFWTVSAIQDVFKSMLKDNKRAYKYFIAALGAIDRTALIHEYSSTFWRPENSANQWLNNRLMDAFCGFLDMHTLHQVLLLQQDCSYDTIVICVGGSHADDIRWALMRIGYTEICDPIIPNGIRNQVPLEPKYFMKLNMQIEELEAERSGGCILM